jgi:tetratricopeptide (TPR) repeat protein
MHHSPSTNIRYLIISFILIFSSVILYFLSIRLLAQLHVRSAETNIIAFQYPAALSELLKAIELQPGDFRIHNELGNVYYRLASKDKEPAETPQMLDKAKEHFQQALRLHPLDARSAYGLARTEIFIEKINSLPGKSSQLFEDSPALQALEQAIELRPASTIYRLAYARYLYIHDDTALLLSEMRNLGRLQPSIHGTLRQEPLWAPAARSEFIKGVERALADGITPRQTNLVISELMVEERRWEEAISYWEQGIAIQPSLNGPADYIRLGYLYLQDRQPDQAQSRFFIAITRSQDVEKDILNILQTCMKADDPESLLRFYRDIVKVYGTSNMIDIAAARHLYDLKDFENARIILQENISSQPYGEAYYWLSRIAEVYQDWDEVELNMQKATMYLSLNSGYHLRFSQVLNRLQKYERAEKEAGLAIKYIDNDSAGLFHYRATLRMKIDDYKGALEDWQEAIRLAPDKATYVYQAGDVLEKMGRVDEAAEYFRKAMELVPGNKTYAQRLERIVKKYGMAPEVP